MYSEDASVPGGGAVSLSQ